MKTKNKVSTKNTPQKPKEQLDQVKLKEHPMQNYYMGDVKLSLQCLSGGILLLLLIKYNDDAFKEFLKKFGEIGGICGMFYFLGKVALMLGTFLAFLAFVIAVYSLHKDGGGIPWFRGKNKTQ